MTGRASHRRSRPEPRKLVYGEPAHPILRALENLELSPADDKGFCEFLIRLTLTAVLAVACAALKAIEGTPPGA